MATIDISERFKARLAYQRFLGSGDHWWIDLEAKMIHLKSNDLTFRILGYDDEVIPQSSRTTYTGILPEKWP